MNKLGLVLCGGGGKGAYQVGVWKAFCEIGLDRYFKTIAGSSVGALNAGLFIQGDIRIAEKIWVEEANSKILTSHSNKLEKWLKSESQIKSFLSNSLLKTLGKYGFFSRDGLEEIMETYLDFNYISKTDIEYYATCVEVDEEESSIPAANRILKKAKSAVEGYFFKNVRYFKMNNHSKEEMKSILLATSALPIVFESIEIEGKKYRDGGILDNSPIQPVIESGCNVVFVIYLNREDSIDKSLYPNTKIYELYPSEYLGSLKSGTLDFSSDGAKRRIQQGYTDTINLLKPIVEMMQLQYRMQLNLEKIYEDMKTSTKNIEQITLDRQNMSETFARLDLQSQQQQLKDRFNL